MSRKTRKRIEGAVDVTKAVARRNPIVDNLLTAKEIGEGIHKIVRGKNMAWHLSRYNPEKRP